MMEGQNDADYTIGNRALSSAVRGSSRPRGAWIDPCCLEVILTPCFQFRLYCVSSLLLTLCVERTLDATCVLTSHVAKRVYHRRDSFIMVAELALLSELL